MISSGIELIKQTWFSTRKKSQSNRSLRSLLDDHDHDIIVANAATEGQEDVIVKEGTSDGDFTVSTSSNNSATKENIVNVKTLNVKIF